MTYDEIRQTAEKLGWNVEFYEQQNSCGDVENYATFSQYSPAGEDFSFNVFYYCEGMLIQGVQNAYADFDIDEHIEMWIEARHNGFKGVPDTRTLVDDAEDIDRMLNELAEALRV